MVKYDAYIRRKNPVTSKWENANIAELPQQEFNRLIVDLLVDAGVLVGVRRETPPAKENGE